jgi:hypothetical protein
LEKTKEIIVPCDCGCSILTFEKDEDSIIVSHYGSSWYSKQDTFWSNFKESVKMIWMIVRGKKFHLYDIIIANDDIEKFNRVMKEFVEQD